MLLVDGLVLDTWSYRRTQRKLTVEITPFRKLDREAVAQLRLSIDDLPTGFSIDETRVIFGQ